MNSFENNNFLLLENFSYWENRKLYLELMKRFINGRIDGTQFDSEFCRMWTVDRNKNYSSKEFLDKIEGVELTKLEGFSALISDLFTDCDVFEPDSALRENYEISEEELKNCVKKTFLEIKDRYP
jgi:hypothetical protein